MDRENADSDRWLRKALNLADGETPFPWQRELLDRFCEGLSDRALDIPTGLGKTAVMAIWLVARALGAPLPRRLVYVVDRRAVVDQATDVAMSLRACVDEIADLRAALGLDGRSLPISTLRGQYLDNREWLEDPTIPAIVVGTVDMIGSRLLFGGYGTSRKMRPYHAGLIGVDALIVLDEAHLVPPFEALVESVADEIDVLGPTVGPLRSLVPRFKLLSLSATGRARTSGVFGLGEADLAHPVVRKRLDATKRLRFVDRAGADLATALANEAWNLCESGSRPVRTIVFADERKIAQSVAAYLAKVAPDSPVELIVGARRLFERQAAAARLRELGFIAGSGVDLMRPTFVVATSAGEVGIDLDADHMACDLVSWERMVQRLGRVNRRGRGAAEVVVSIDGVGDSPTLRAPFGHLSATDGVVDASPGSLGALKKRAQVNSELQAYIDEATTRPPLRPGLSRPLVDAWSMTSLEEHAGRPEIDPWLRGWAADDKPQTALVWRARLPFSPDGEVRFREVALFFEAAPPHPSELLETETYRVVDWLLARAAVAKGILSPVAVILDRAGELLRPLRIGDLLPQNKRLVRRVVDDLNSQLAGRTLVVDFRLAGLDPHGLLDEDCVSLPRTLDDGQPWLDGETPGASGKGTPIVRYKVRVAGESSAVDPRSGFRERFRMALERDGDGDPRSWLVVDKWRHDAETEDDRSAGRPQLLEQHQEWTEKRALAIASRLSLPPEYQLMLALAARLHDEGKRSPRWQRAFHAGSNGTYAKTLGPVSFGLLGGYRHELGSLGYAERDDRLSALPAGLRDLALHLIVAHHGFARPLIRTVGCDEPPSVLEKRARDVALRFARLQQEWGPWGLAWWEALLRAADQQASKENDRIGPEGT